MHPVVKSSLVLAAAVGIFSALFYALGLHENFVVGQAIFLAVAIGLNIAILIRLLTRTADTDGYGKQVVNSAGLGLLGGVLITLVSWALLSFVFPNALAELRQGAVTYMAESDMSAAEVDAQMEMLDAATPMSQSLPGGLGTFFTSLVGGAVFAIWKRKK